MARAARLWAVAAALLGAVLPAFGQASYPVQAQASAPTGSCSSTTYKGIVIVQSTGQMYACVGGTWTAVGGGSPAGISDASFAISYDGSSYIAKNGRTGVTDYSASDPGSVIQSAITALGSSGGTISLAAGTYTYTSTIPNLPNTLTGWLVIRGAGPATVLKLSSGAPRAFGLASGGAGVLTFRKIQLSGFDVDANSITGTSQDPVICCTTTSTPNYYEFQDIIVRDIHAYNIVEASHRRGLAFDSPHPAGSDSYDTTTTRVTVDNVHLSGGWNGVGFGCSSANASCRHTLDQIVIQNSSHVRVGGTDAQPGTSFYVGGYSDTGSVIMRNLYSEGSGDDGIEINQPRFAVVDSCTVRNAIIHAFVLTNYRNDVTNYKRSWFVTNSRAIVDTSLTHTGLKGQGFVIGGTSVRTGTNDMDQVTITASEYKNTANGDGPFYISGRTRKVNVSDFFSWSTKNVSAASYSSTYNSDVDVRIWVEGATTTTPRAEITFSNVRISKDFNYTADGSHFVSVQGATISGPQVDLKWENVDFDIDGSGISDLNNDVVGVCLGCYQYDLNNDGTATDQNTLLGYLDDLKVTVTGNAAVKRAVYVDTDAKLAKALRIDNLVNATGGYAIEYANSGVTRDGMSCSGVLGYDADCDFSPEVRYADRYATGGVGDSASPYTGWESAIAADTVTRFPCGYYALSSTLTINTVRSSLVGDGECSVIFGGPAASHSISVAASNVTISGFKLDGDKLHRASGTEVLRLDTGSTSALVRNVHIVNIPDTGVNFNGSGTRTGTVLDSVYVETPTWACFRIYNYAGLTIRNSRCETQYSSARTAVQVTGGTDFLTFSGNVVDDRSEAYGIGVEIDGNGDTENVISGNWFYEYQVGVRDNGVASVVTGNNFHQTNLYGIQTQGNGNRAVYSFNTFIDLVNPAIYLTDTSYVLGDIQVLGNWIKGTGSGIQVDTVRTTAGEAPKDIVIAGNWISTTYQCVLTNAAGTSGATATVWGNYCKDNGANSQPSLATTNWTYGALPVHRGIQFGYGSNLGTLGAASLTGTRNWGLQNMSGNVVLTPTGWPTSQCATWDANGQLAGTGSACGGSGSPGGSTTQVQYNDAGSFEGATNLQYNKTTNVTTIGTADVGLLTNAAMGGMPWRIGAGVFNNWIWQASSFTIEGSSDDAYETTISFTNPTADRTITFPDTTGTICLDTGSGCGAGGSPGGSDTHVQYNSSGSFAGESTFTYTAAEDRIRAGKVTVGDTCTLGAATTLAAGTLCRNTTNGLMMSNGSNWYTAMWSQNASGEVWYSGSNYEPTNEAAFAYNAGTNTLTAGTFSGALSGNASTATALAADPTDCSTGNVATTIAASGALTCKAETMGVFTFSFTNLPASGTSNMRPAGVYGDSFTRWYTPYAITLTGMTCYVNASKSGGTLAVTVQNAGSNTDITRDTSTTWTLNTPYSDTACTSSCAVSADSYVNMTAVTASTFAPTTADLQCQVFYKF